jgi:hypothetical protein
MENEEKKKKGFFSMIWESMTKTGGCCGPGETCGGQAKEDDNKTVEDENTKEHDN